MRAPRPNGACAAGSGPPLAVEGGVDEMATTANSLGAAARSKKRPASPGNGSGLGPSKKKKVPAAPNAPQQSVGAEAMNENKFMTADPSTGPMEATIKPLPFKDPNFIHSGIGGAAAGKKNRTWKNLKQILASERALPWQLNDPSYFNIDAPPSFRPAKKYSDISGLPLPRPTWTSCRSSAD
ncbi:INO80 complex subunit C isoform X2 [Emydura macquarii macquarii]|uniref:INO80 complex subunit C isoform X2 n=1 Tax=Emydura macquarii macquarii TaxID=1129001 RepID=UPI00352A7BED